MISIGIILFAIGCFLGLFLEHRYEWEEPRRLEIVAGVLALIGVFLFVAGVAVLAWRNLP